MEPNSALDHREFPILVVDDEPDILSSFRLAFRREFTIHCADGGVAGLTSSKSIRRGSESASPGSNRTRWTSSRAIRIRATCAGSGSPSRGS